MSEIKLSVKLSEKDIITINNLILEAYQNAQKNTIDKFIKEVKKKGFYDEIIEKDLIDFLNKFKRALNKDYTHIKEDKE